MMSSPSNDAQSQSQSIGVPEAGESSLPTASSRDRHGGTGDGNDDTVVGGDQATASNEDGGGHPQAQLPIEYQVHEVDLTSPEMDPLEYAFRRYVPVPKAYFWDTACSENGYNQDLPFRLKMWHRSIFWGGECLRRAEAAGGVIADFLGLNDGPFDYVTGNMTEEEMARSRRIVASRREEQEEIQRRGEGAGV